VHVVVVGCGRVGSGLASSLTVAGHTVAVIDRRSAAFNRLSPDFTGKRLTGIGFDREVLKEAGIEGATAVAAVTNGDNSNILIARVARETFGIQRVVARIYDPRRAVIFQRLGIPTVATVAWTTERVLRRILPDEAVEWVDPSAKVSLVERVVPAPVAGRPISEFEADGTVRFTAVSRLGSAQVASPQFILQEGDVVYAAVATESLAAFDARISGQEGKGGH
jgi:trk system potassium uptake protein TrkA